MVDPRAELDDDVRIGHHCVIGANVKVGRGTRLENSVTLTGHTNIGRDNRFFPGCVIGGEPQDLSYQGSPTQVVIGDSNVFRECVTVNRGTEKDEGITSIVFGGAETDFTKQDANQIKKISRCFYEANYRKK